MDPTLAGSILQMLRRDLGAFEDELERFPSDEAVWVLPEGIANSAGTLALHVSGNLLHYVGALLGGTGYVRDRAAEFSQRGLSREELRERLQEARAVVDQVLPGLSDESLRDPFPDPPEALPRATTVLVLLHLVTHLAYHLGQANYHRRLTVG